MEHAEQWNVSFVQAAKRSVLKANLSAANAAWNVLDEIDHPVYLMSSW